MAKDADDDRTVLAELAAEEGLEAVDKFVIALLSLRLRCAPRLLPPQELEGLGSPSPMISDGQYTAGSEPVAHCSNVKRLLRSGRKPSRSLLRTIFCELRSTCRYANEADSMTILSGSRCNTCADEKLPL